MGKANSSVTRVWPVFDHLLGRDATGRSWLPELLRLGQPSDAMGEQWKEWPGELVSEASKFGRAIPGNLRGILGRDGCARLKSLRGAFEAEFAPPAKFLRWMIENPHRLTWPKDRGKESAFGEPTQSLRKILLNGDGEVRAQALQSLEQAGGAGSRRMWWAFEGWTSVDCWLETDRVIVFIEGKRTEPISNATDWFPVRNQVARNLEVAAEVSRDRGKDFAVIVCAEQPVSLTRAAFDESMPHLDITERENLFCHYLGSITWRQIRDILCPTVELPENVESAIEFCSRLR